MQKVEAQRSQTPHQAPQRQGGGVALESPQSDLIAQLEAVVEASPQVGGVARFAAMANRSPQAAAQRRTMDMIVDSPRMVAQQQQLAGLSGEAALQAKVAQREEAPAKANNTGLPDNLKSGIESLSGISMDNVRVHYNSSQPAQLNALAYAQGTDIHVAPGQELHLPHEAWHVVQQAQGRVKPTMQAKGTAINDDVGLECEADAMGAKAAQVGTVQAKQTIESGSIGIANMPAKVGGLIQRHISWDPGANQFVIDNARPAWMGTIGAMQTGLLQSKNHIVPFAGIQNDLCILLNQLLGAPNNGQFENEIISLCESLFPTQPPPDYQTMVNRRTACITAINNGNAGQYHATSRALLSALNSSPDNVRAGDSINNLRIGENLDADFNAGTVHYNGNVISNGVLQAFNGNVLTLTQASNSVIFEYFHQQENSAAIQGGFGLTFVLSLLTGRQISSGTGPTAGGLFAGAFPVLVTDPNGVNSPYLFQ